MKKVKFLCNAGDVVRSVAISALAIALGAYAMMLQDNHFVVAILAAVVLLVAVGTILQVSRAVQQLHQKHAQTKQASLKAERHYFKVLRRIMAAVESREPYTRGRSKRIGYLSRQIGLYLGLEPDYCRLLDLAGQVHDIGLLSVPEYILNKPPRLGREEFRSIQKHAEISYRILEPLTFLREILPAVRFHHERMNGTGYPYGLKGKDIPLSARILAVADAYDAMTHDRPHRPALPTIEAINELRRCSPAGYDPKCVAALEELLNMRQLRKLHQSTRKDAPVETSSKKTLSAST
mgnify:CR=1 FL=1